MPSLKDLKEFVKNLLTQLEGLTNLDLSRASGIIFSSYGKILLETPYDELAKTEFFQRFKELAPTIKHILVFGMCSAEAFLDQKMGEGTAFRLALKEILKDSASEIGKRIINGDKYASMVSSSPEKIVIRLICDMDQELRKKFVAWMLDATPEERVILLRAMQGLSSDEISKIMDLSIADAVTLLKPPEKPKKQSFWDRINETLTRYNATLEKRMSDKKGEKHV